MIFIMVMSVVIPTSQLEVDIALFVVAKRMAVEASVCVRKYFVAPSVARG